TETFPETRHGAMRKISDKQEDRLMEHSLQYLPNDWARQAFSLKSEVALARSCSDVFWGSRKQDNERDQTKSSERLNHKRSWSPGARRAVQRTGTSGNGGGRQNGRVALRFRPISVLWVRVGITKA